MIGRGIITKFMIAPYTKDSWEIYIQKKDSKIYMTELKLPEYGSDLKSQKFTFYGYKFESLCTSSSQVNTNIEYCSVFSSRFGNIRVILGGEVDCIQDKEYIELKTSRVLDSKRSVINFSRKLIRIWAQSYLVGISKIIFGFRNDDGILKDLKTYNTHEIASIAKSKGDWNRNSCLHFTETLLNWLLTETCDQSSYTLSKTNDTLELKECNDTFIPNWYSIQS
jgi:RAT1-interacting protein